MSLPRLVGISYYHVLLWDREKNHLLEKKPIWELSSGRRGLSSRLPTSSNESKCESQRQPGFNSRYHGWSQHRWNQWKEALEQESDVRRNCCDSKWFLFTKSDSDRAQSDSKPSDSTRRWKSARISRRFQAEHCRERLRPKFLYPQSVHWANYASSKREHSVPTRCQNIRVGRKHCLWFTGRKPVLGWLRWKQLGSHLLHNRNNNNDLDSSVAWIKYGSKRSS